MISVSSFMRTPILLRNACVRASVLDIDKEKTSLAAIMVKGTSVPNVCAMPKVDCFKPGRISVYPKAHT